MGVLSKHRVLISGVLSPILAVFLSARVGRELLRMSPKPQQNWLLRLCLSTAVMLVPFAITLVLFMKERHGSGLRMSAKIGLALAVLSLTLTAKPVNDGINRSKQEKNKQIRGVPAPLFETSDLSGKPQRLADYKGKVVLVNIWATWCAPCRAEMPALDRLYQERKDRGFVVIGMSNESIPTQKQFLKIVSVSYPLLMLNGDVPSFYRDIARYPEVFLIDRDGRLQPTPEPGQPFEKLAEDVDALLRVDPTR
jgi:thiol-disulfide isomerase/thioredoxin